MRKLTKKELRNVLIIYKNHYNDVHDIILYKKGEKWNIEIIYQGFSGAPIQFSIKEDIDNIFDEYCVVDYTNKELTQSENSQFLYENILEKIEEYEKEIEEDDEK